MSGAGPLLEVRDLSVEFALEEGRLRAVDRVSLDLGAGEVLAVVGESGSGKSVTALTLLGLTGGPNASVEGSARFEGVELIGAPEERLRAIRGARVAMVFQDPGAALNPVHRVGDQIAEQIRAHRDVDAAAARRRAVELLDSVGIARAAERVDAYPHELSGGMRQRVTIAMALSLDPAVLIADEPTTALDATVQAQVVQLLRDLNRERGLSILLITHDIGVVAEVADRVAVMYAGRVVEQGTAEAVFHDPQHPYTWGLLGSVIRVDRPRLERLPQIPGAPPSPLDLPRGCHFRPRCPHAFERCVEAPGLERRLDEAPDHLDRCWLEPAEKRERRRVGGAVGPRASGGAG